MRGVASCERRLAGRAVQVGPHSTACGLPRGPSSDGGGPCDVPSRQSEHQEQSWADTLGPGGGEGERMDLEHGMLCVRACVCVCVCVSNMLSW